MSAATPERAGFAVLLPLDPAARAARSDLEGLGWSRAVLRGSVLMGLLGALVAAVVLAEARGQVAAAERAGVLSIMLKWAPLIFTGFLFNLLVSVLSMTIGTVAGFGLGIAQVSLLAPARRTSWLITQFFRNAPWLVLLFYCMFLLPFEVSVFGWSIPLPAWMKAVIGLSLPVMANVSEVVRGGIQSIPAPQWEAAESLAFTRRQTMWRIILPQAIKRMLPPWMNIYAILTMATTLISVVGVQDSMTLTRGALVAEGRPDLFIPMYLMLLSWFFIYCYAIARWTLSLEQRFAVNA